MREVLLSLSPHKMIWNFSILLTFAGLAVISDPQSGGAGGGGAVAVLASWAVLRPLYFHWASSAPGPPALLGGGLCVPRPPLRGAGIVSVLLHFRGTGVIHSPFLLWGGQRRLSIPLRFGEVVSLSPSDLGEPAQAPSPSCFEGLVFSPSLSDLGGTALCPSLIWREVGTVAVLTAPRHSPSY